MLYLSLFFIFSGLLFLVYALIVTFSEKPGAGKTAGAGVPKQVHTLRDEAEKKGPSAGEELVVPDVVPSRPAPGESFSEELRDFGVDEHDDVEISEDNDNFLPDDSEDFYGDSAVEEKTAGEGETESDFAAAVLYEDSSHLIDYSSEKGIIDPRFDHYREIRRIDEGKLLLEKEGFSFYCGKKFFRFDFIKAENVYISHNSIAVIYHGDVPVRLFILPEKTEFTERARAAYREFLESRSSGESDGDGR